MKIKITLLFIVFSIGIKAQEYKLFVASTDKSIQLKWMSKSHKANATFDIYRKENNEMWQKINDKVISASPIIKESELKSNKNLFPKDSAYAFYIAYKSKNETDKNKQEYANYLLAIASVYDNKLAQHLGIYFEDTNVVSQKKYQYKLVAASSQKEESVSTLISLGNETEAPKELKATQEKKHLNLTWKSNEEFIGYNIYKNNKKINATPILANLEDKTYQVSYQDEAVQPGNYKYIIKGITFLTTQSKASTEIIIDVKDATPAIGIKNLKTTRNDTEIKLTWSASNDNEAKGYFVFKSDDKGKSYKKLNASMLDVKSQEFSEKLTPETSGTFQYYIETVDALGNATQSIKVATFVPDHKAPEMPKAITSKSESGKISLSWMANSDKDLLGYCIYRGLKNDDENSMLLLHSEPLKTTSFTDVFPKNANTKFIYKVAAIDQSFNESKKAEVWAQLPDVVAPNAPFLAEAILRENKVVLKWNLMPNDAIMSYDVFRIFENKKQKLNTSNVLQDNFVDDKIDKKGIYQYYIQAIDSAKLASKPSNSLYVSTVNSVSKNSVKLIAKQEARSKKVQLEIIGIQPNEVQVFKLYRKTANSGFKLLPIKFSNAIFIDETSEAGKIYQYYIDVTDFNDVKIKSEVTTFNNS